MYVIVWRFEIRPGSEAEFEALYGPSGRWAALFRRGAGFCATELLRGDPQAREYLTIDRWDSGAAYDEFRHAHAEAYDALDSAGDHLTVTETHLGSFHLVER